MIKKIGDLLNTTNITIGMSIMISVVSAIMVNLIFSFSKFIEKLTRQFIINTKSKVFNYIDYKKREKTGNLTLVEQLLKIDRKTIIENSKNFSEDE